MGSIWSILGNLLGIGKDYLSNKQKAKIQAQEHEMAIKAALNKAEVDRVLSNTEADNQIDLQTARDKAKTWKDEIVSYTILIPLITATFVPVLVAIKTGNWEHLTSEFVESYKSLNSLPEWYMWALGLVIIDVLGFRSFSRKVVEQVVNKWKKK